MPQEHVLSLRLALMGRPVRTFVFGKPVITVGRDPDADIFIDNPGVSREHLRFELNPEGEYEVVDLGSANGTLLNDMPVKVKIPLRSGDTVRLGKYTVTVSYELDRRDSRHSYVPNPETDSSTMVLSRVELNHLLERQHQAEMAPPPEEEEEKQPVAASTSRGGVAQAAWTAGFVGFLLGAAVGVAVARIVVF